MSDREVGRHRREWWQEGQGIEAMDRGLLSAAAASGLRVQLPLKTLADFLRPIVGSSKKM